MQKFLIKETGKTGTEEEKLTLPVSQMVKNIGEMLQEAFVESSNGPEIFGEEHSFIKWPEGSRESNSHLFW